MSDSPVKKASPRKLLLVASSGGHLAELDRLVPELHATPDSLWVTFDTPQSRSLLAGRRRIHVPYVRPRDIVGVARAAAVIQRVLHHENFDGAVSTGAAIAVAALPLAAAHGVPSLYIESVSRVDGPSLSGRIIAATRLVSLRTQYASWSSDRWKLQPSILSTFHSEPRTPAPRPSLFVTLGTIEGYRFDALIDAVLRTGLADHRTVWQLGFTADRVGLPGTIHEQMRYRDFQQAAQDADVVITHAGVGSLLGLLDLGIYPVLVSRRISRNEHVDDHQHQISQLAGRLGVAAAIDAPELDAAIIHAAARRHVYNAAADSVRLGEKFEEGDG
ncbi:MAG: glycosyltransferase [Microbacteriaceae bacterium]|nr:glycosyltransferase [Microbacteriaceae bacterium]